MVVYLTNMIVFQAAYQFVTSNSAPVFLPLEQRPRVLGTFPYQRQRPLVLARWSCPCFMCFVLLFHANVMPRTSFLRAVAGLAPVSSALQFM